MPCKHRIHTPITSGSQRGAMGIAYASKKGKRIKGGLRGPAKEIKRSMTKTELKSHLKESAGKDLPSTTQTRRLVKLKKKAKKS